MTLPEARPEAAAIDDRQRLGRVLQLAGVVGVAASLVVGIVGWIVADNGHEVVGADADFGQ